MRCWSLTTAWLDAQWRKNANLDRRQECPQSTLIECQFVRTANGHVCLWELALLLTIPRNAYVGHVQALSRSGQES